MSDVVLHQLTKRFDTVPVLEGIDLEVRDGELLVLVGPSGCGKTTLLRMIAGLETPTSGEIQIGGRAMQGVPPKDRNVAMVFQDYALYPHMSVFENLAFGLKMRRVVGDEIRRRVARAAALLGIEGVLDRKPAELSGGQQQRVALGRALVREPAVFLLDEPLSNLDAQLRVTMRTELVRLHRRIAATLLYVTHDQTEAMMMGSRVVVLEGGRIRQAGPPMEIYRRPADRFVAEFIGAPPMNFLEGHLVPGSEPSLRVADQRWPVPPELERWTGAEMPVTVGLRPEALSPANGGHSKRPAVQLECEVELVQPLGAESIVMLGWRGHALQAVYRSAQVAPWGAGQRVRWSVDPGELHVFERQPHGRRLSGR